MKGLFNRIQNFSLTQKVAASSALMVVGSSFPAFASDPPTPTPSDLSSMLDTFSDMAAWMWSEVGLLLTFIIGQPILLAAMALFFIGSIVAFFIRVYHTV